MSTQALPTTEWQTRRMMPTTMAVGVALGIAYTLSPLATLGAVATIFLGRALVRDLEGAERQVMLAIFVVAVVLRLALVAGLFLSIDHSSTPFGSLFGDEEYFKRRSLWLRSMALGVNVSEADRTYALDEYSETSYLYLLAFVQMIVGDAPYGIHVVSMCAYLAGAVWLFRFSRRVYGPAPAAIAFTGVLFMPTLFFWSVSALRESVHFLLTFAAIAGASDALTRERWRARIVGGGVAGAAILLLRDLREGSMVALLLSLLVGTAAAMAVRSWRHLAVAVVAVAVAGGFLLSRPATQERAMSALRTTALMHQGHAFTPGIHYKLLEPKFYRDRVLNIMDDLTPQQAGRYVLRSLVAALVVPWPWQAETLMLKAYLPEHVVWLVLATLLPVGVWAGARRHPEATFIVTAYVAVMFAGIALRSGNVGTLVRHRGLVLPFVICLGAVAICHVLWRLASTTSAQQGPITDGPHR